MNPTLKRAARDMAMGAFHNTQAEMKRVEHDDELTEAEKKVILKYLASRQRINDQLYNLLGNGEEQTN